MSTLKDIRVLVVEDEAFVAVMLADMLVELGARVVGPAGSIADALSLAGAAEIDMAVLDVNVRDERIDPVAAALSARGIPFVLATGYGKAPAEIGDGVPVLDKPYDLEKLRSALAGLLAAT